MEIRTVPNTLKPPVGALERDPAAAPAATAASASVPGVARGDEKLSKSEDNDVHQAVERINKSLPQSSQGIEFSVDDDSDRVIVKVIDRETREVLRQMPTKEALEIAKALDRTQGMLIKLEA